MNGEDAAQARLFGTCERCGTARGIRSKPGTRGTVVELFCPACDPPEPPLLDPPFAAFREFADAVDAIAARVSMAMGAVLAGDGRTELRSDDPADWADAARWDPPVRHLGAGAVTVIHPVYVDGPLLGEKKPAYEGFPVQAVAYDSPDALTGHTVAYQMTQFGWHAGGKMVVVWIAWCGPEPDAEVIAAALFRPEVLERADIRVMR